MTRLLGVGAEARDDGHVPDIDLAHGTCGAVVGALSEAERARVPVERELHVRSALAALARCRALLISIAMLDRTGRADAVGVLLRAMLEAWYFGVICLLGDEDDLNRLEEDNRYWKNDFAKHRPGLPLESGMIKKFSVRARAKRAGELMHLVNEDGDAPLDWYNDLYAGESLTNAHASPSSMGPYLFVDASGVIGVDHDPQLDEGLRYGRLLLAANLTVTLARWTYERAGIDTTAVDAVDFPTSH